MRPSRFLFMGAGVLVTTVLPVPAAYAAVHCFGRPVDYFGGPGRQHIAAGYWDLLTVHMGAGNDGVSVATDSPRMVTACLGDGDDFIDSGDDPRGALVWDLDGGPGKDRAVIQACFQTLSSSKVADIVVRNVERLVIRPCRAPQIP